MAVAPLLATAQWNLISERITAFDMLTTRVGLTAMTFPIQQVLARYDDGILTGYKNVDGKVTSIIIRDTNTAYLSVKGEGIYVATNNWKDLTLIAAATESSVLCVYKSTVLVLVDKRLKFSSDGAQFAAATGIDPSDSIVAAEAFSDKTLLAVAGSTVYRSLNGGLSWVPVSDTLGFANSIYLDRSRGIFYIGGSDLYQSLDSGATWEKLKSIFFDPLSGPVVGSRDCSGVLYLEPDAATHGELYRSVNQGQFFQSVGPAYLSLTRPKRAVVLDRGSTFFSLDEGNILSVSHNGVDGNIPDLIIDRVVTLVDTPVHSSLCPNAPLVFGSYSIAYDECTGLVLDSIVPVGFNSAFSPSFSSQFIGDTKATFPFAFKAKKEGPDSANYRIRFHSPTTQNVENTFVTLRGFGEASGAFLSLGQSSIEFGNVGVDSVRKRTLSLKNTGCDTLFIDSLVSSAPSLFHIDPKSYPVAILSGQNFSVDIRFTPQFEGPYLEAATLGTSVGTRYITLHGTATKNGEIDTLIVEEEKDKRALSIYPNPSYSVVVIKGVPDRSPIWLLDNLGRMFLPPVVSSDSDSMTLDLTSYSPGHYLLISPSQGLSQKIVRY